ncbi:hypothetical protein ZWY2020_001503 [Hordeum vulgare]|nr:hypothetical protein ZWY2020_001503 [Hordeum vulgare]
MGRRRQQAKGGGAQRIWDLHDKLEPPFSPSPLSAFTAARRPNGGPGAHAIRAALEDLEGHLHFLRMAEIDTRPLESVQSALNLFEQRSDHSRFSSPDRNEQDIDVVAKELATCKLQLEAKESENKQANMKLEAMRKTMQDLS